MSRRLSDEEVLAQIAAARERGRQAAATDPARARSVGYDRQRGLVTVELNSGALFAFPPRLAPGLESATPEELSQVEVSPSGIGLRWEALDADLSVPALLEAVLGKEAAMRQLARAGGSVRSEAKARAARENGAKGGRPKKAHAPGGGKQKAPPGGGAAARPGGPEEGEDCRTRART